MIKIRNFSKRELYNNFNLDIDDGITYLKGKNGSGKTTLLDCISGLDTSYSGTITGNENIVYLNQQLYFSGRLKAKDMVQFLLRLQKIKNYKEYYWSKMEEYKKIFDYEKIWEKEIRMLSGGELKLFFFTIISVIEKKNYIFDEPFASVDSAGKELIILILKKLVRQEKNIIITSHEEEFKSKFNDISIIDLG
ncbi:ATP-binding cassette domain-containing protein [Velocimicrobium porci]|uniref:ATP-binding cassette domain-containing protein n=1 Tax=Velocimicrobium porci TaxID=2606634 RepID=A0A6L5XUL1_9FIRM|nr:ATP-binding cassette domain-containing protein [Velocimicrobium porci]MSS62486.1 ATP-binding cassette domain-containing protein [Velocimicrobium porci]